MFTRRVLTFVAAFAFLFTTAAFWGATGDELEGETDANVVATSGAATGTEGGVAPEKKKKGNRLFRAFKAPFKAVGSLFKGGDDRGELARMTEKDAARFESAGVVRVEDGRTERARPTGGEGTARDHLDRGRALLAENRLNDAIEELSRAASLDPRLGQAHSLLAVAFERKGLRERARESYERAVEVNESDAQALNNLGYSLYAAGNYRAAADKLKRAARLAPGDARILNNLALAQCRLGKFDEAFRNFARAGGEFAGHTNTAALLARLGWDEKAISHLEAARRLRPEDGNVLRQLADLYEREGRRDKAEEARAALRAEDERRHIQAANGGR
ncbi:MAG TPA: tetratricopeptide repeat protein [Pyrinomonadaceae bacterium]|nr:tetratricopeptide repeat protein [Pyrinomonadaceae bacterium]